MFLYFISMWIGNFKIAVIKYNLICMKNMTEFKSSLFLKNVPKKYITHLDHFSAAVYTQ